MYASTIKLCQDNKINTRNTWTLNLIDYMSMLVGPQSSTTPTRSDAQTQRTPSEETPSRSSPSAETDFQLAGATLDAGVRIYCSRVDSVHNNAFKVLGGLSQAGPESAEDSLKETDSDDGTLGANADDTSDPQKKCPKSGRSGRTTLVSSPGVITLSRLETDLAVDPLFQNMSAAFDEGGAAGMLVHNLPLAPSGAIIFDSAETADVLIPDVPGPPVSDSDTDQSFVSMVDFPLPPNPEQDNVDICPKFFRLLRSELHLAVDNNTPSQTFDASQPSSVPSSWPLEENSSTAVSFQYGENDLDNIDSFGVSELDTELTTDTNNFDGDQNEDDVDLFSHINSNLDRRDSTLATLSAARRGTLDLVQAGLPLEGGDYSFFASSLSTMGWAGPSHWRYRPGLAGSHGLKGKENEKRRRPRGRTAQLLDFSSDAPDEDFSKLFESGKSWESNQLSQSVRASMTKERVTLPVDLQISPHFLTELFLRPGTSVSLKNQSKEPVQEDTCGEAGDSPTWQDFDRDNGNVDDCAEMGDPSAEVGGGDVADSIDFDVEHNRGWDESQSGRLSLGRETQSVQAIDINYAKVAKRVDVRALKSGLWSRLCGESGTEESGNVVEEDNRVRKRDVRRGDVVQLKEVVNDAQAFVPAESQGDVSLAYVFICLLHLANEQELMITQAQIEAQDGNENGRGRALDDLTIKRDEVQKQEIED